MKDPTPRDFVPVVIIGGGMSGIAMACQLNRKLGFTDYIIYDRAEGIGGTWWMNNYPGCGLDIPVSLYSYSFAPNNSCAKVYASRDEVLQYISNVAKTFDVNTKFRGKTSCVGAIWQEATSTWELELEHTETKHRYRQQCQILISAVGAFVDPAPCNIPGIEDFQGEVVHTARWKNIELNNKNVVVVGNGASAAQVIPAIAGEVKSLLQFSRSPQYYVPRPNYTIPEPMQVVMQKLVLLGYFIRLLLFFYLESSYIHTWNNWIGRRARRSRVEECRAYVEDVAPSKYWSQLMPEYEYGCKRPIYDRDYLRCIQRKNFSVTLDGISSMTKDAIITQSGSMHPVDVIILATGFNIAPFSYQLQGRGGNTLEGHWSRFGRREAYKSVAMHNFPNFFHVLGPNSTRLYSSVVFSIENFVDLIIRRIAPVIRSRGSYVEIKRQSEEKYSQHVLEALRGTIYSPNCQSWLFDKETGTNWAVYPWHGLWMWLSTRFDSGMNWSYGLASPTDS